MEKKREIRERSELSERWLADNETRIFVNSQTADRGIVNAEVGIGGFAGSLGRNGQNWMRTLCGCWAEER